MMFCSCFHGCWCCGWWCCCLCCWWCRRKLGGGKWGVVGAGQVDRETRPTDSTKVDQFGVEKYPGQDQPSLWRKKKVRQMPMRNLTQCLLYLTFPWFFIAFQELNWCRTLNWAKRSTNWFKPGGCEWVGCEWVGGNGDGCSDLLLLFFCCLLICPAVLELIRTWWRIGFWKKTVGQVLKQHLYLRLRHAQACTA